MKQVTRLVNGLGVDSSRTARQPQTQRQTQRSAADETASACYSQSLPLTRQPQFGGLRGFSKAFVPKLVDKLVPTFQTITEVFLAAFLAQDVISMWLPRIRQSLVRGAIPYEPDKDPDNKQLTPWQLTKRYWGKTLKGLNWVNFSEETKREFATGPGVLIIPAVFFAMARRWFGKSSVELGYGPLTKLTDSFVEHLKQSPIGAADTVTPDAFKAELEKFVVSRFGFDAELLKSAIVMKGEAQPLTVGAFLRKWANQWVDAVFEANGNGKGAHAKATETLAKLDEQLVEFVTDGVNRPLRTSEYLFKVDQLPIKMVERVKAGGRKTFQEKVHDVPVGEFAANLGRWKDYMLEVFNTKMKGVVNKEGQSIKLPELAEKFYQEMVTRKGLFSIGVTLFTGYYLIKLAKWAQSHETYEANRLLQEGPTTAIAAHGKKPEPVAFQPAASSSQPQNDLDALLTALSRPEPPAPKNDWVNRLPARPAVSAPVQHYAPQPVAQYPNYPVSNNRAYTPTATIPTALPYQYAVSNYSSPAFGPVGSQWGAPAPVGYPNIGYQQNALSGFYPAGIQGVGAWGAAPGGWNQGGAV